MRLTVSKCLHFKLPAVQSWALKCYEDSVRWLGQAEAKRMQYRRRRDGSDPDRMRDVHKALGNLLTEVAVGPELLYVRLPASSLDGQPLATAIVAHLARPAIPTMREYSCDRGQPAQLSKSRSVARVHC